MLLYHIFCTITGVLVMSDAQKHPLLESTSSGEVWFGFEKIAIVMTTMMMMKQPTTADLALDPGSPPLKSTIKVHLNSFKSLFKSLTQFSAYKSAEGIW